MKLKIKCNQLIQKYFIKLKSKFTNKLSRYMRLDQNPIKRYL